MLARSRSVNFSLVIEAAPCRHQATPNRGTSARAHARLRLRLSAWSGQAAPSNLDQSRGDSSAPGVRCRRKICRSGCT